MPQNKRPRPRPPVPEPTPAPPAPPFAVDVNLKLPEVVRLGVVLPHDGLRVDLHVHHHNGDGPAQIARQIAAVRHVTNRLKYTARQLKKAVAAIHPKPAATDPEEH